MSPTALDIDMGAMAEELLDEFMPLTLRDPGHLGTVTAPTESPTSGADTDYSVKGIVTQYSRADVATNTVERDDLRIFVSRKVLDDLGVTPLKDWEIGIDGRFHRIKSVMRVANTGEQFALYELQVEG